MHMHAHAHTHAHSPGAPADLDHVLLDAERVAVPQDAEQLVVGNEEEPGEGVPLGIQVVVQALLALLQALADVLQVVEAVRGLAAPLDHGVLQGLAHDLDEVEKRAVSPGTRWHQGLSRRGRHLPGPGRDRGAPARTPRDRAFAEASLAKAAGHSNTLLLSTLYHSEWLPYF